MRQFALAVLLLFVPSFVTAQSPSRPASSAQIDARMFRYPAVSRDRIAFVYAGDIWIVPRTGGWGTRLSSPLGEESFPRFSPGGTKIAFSGDYDGNTDVYVVSVTGGQPTRLTYHPMDDRVLGWTPDGSRVLFVSSRESGRQRYNQFYTVGLDGGLPDKLPVPYGEFGTYSADGKQLVYMPMSQDFRTWKRYRGGWAPDLWLFDLNTFASRNLTNDPAIDAQPMWHGNTLYFMSDRGANQRQNIWALDMSAAGAKPRQVTQFADFDITFPSAGPDAIVFQAGGRLYLLDFASEKATEVRVNVVTDEMTLRPRTAKAEPLIQDAAPSPSGKRAVFAARGDVFTVPAEHGAIVNLTRSSGVAERSPTWSPDGKTVAYWSDRSGEYELTVRPADGPGAEKKLTSLGAGFRYTPYWSPDSRKLVFIDQAMRTRIYDIDTGKVTDVDRSPEWISQGGLDPFRFQWSPDSRWVTFARPATPSNAAIFLFDTKSARLNQVTSGYLNDTQPTFDPEGKYLYYASDRAFSPVYSAFDNSWTYANPTQIIAVPLRKDVKSPLYARNDAEGPAVDTEDKKKEEEKKEENTKQETKKTPATTEPAVPEEKKTDEKPAAPPSVDIDIDGFESRAVILPPKNGNYSGLSAVKGKVIYRRQPRTGSGDEKSPIVYFDLEEREEKTILDDADGFEPTADGKKLFVVNDRKFAFVEIKPQQKFEKPMATADMEAPVDPRAEWRQLFNDTFRFERDYFYDPNMHGVNWPELRDRYGRLIDDAVTRWDVDWVIGEFIAELNSSHTYKGGGDMEKAIERTVGMLGVDWELANGTWRIKRIVRGGAWDASGRSPLDEPGVNVKEGEYVLAVNGIPLDTKADPYASFQGFGDKTVVLTVNASPSMTGARQVVVTALKDETALRFADWIEQRRRDVDKASGGRIGYIYVQSTGVDAQNDLVRQFMAQWQKDGLIIDERWNSGGQIPDRFIELLNRPMLSYWAVRDAHPQQWPPVAHAGAQAMLINGWSGSGGDAFPFYFREAGLGPLIGSRTWGGLIGVSGVPGLIDGGGITVPTFRMFDPKGNWFAEGHGVDPDIKVDEDPTSLAKGTDPQLERAIKEVMDRIAKQPAKPRRPAYEKRVPGSR